jgi:hypothetical protein
MGAGLFVAGIGWDIVEDVRGTVAMCMFIMEEATQTAMMGEWIAVKENMVKEAIDLDLWISQYLATQGLDMASTWAANAAYPLNLAYQMFFSATLKTLDIYTQLLFKKMHEGE